MSASQQRQESIERTDAFDTSWAWRGGSVAGLVAAAIMGVFISAFDLPTLRVSIAGLYGLEGSLAAGWLAHLVHGALFGSVFAAVMADPGLYRVSEWVWKSAVAGVVYGMVLAIAGAGIIMPIWLGLAGLPTPESIPNVTVPILLWHFVYGLVLGVLFPYVEDL